MQKVEAVYQMAKVVYKMEKVVCKMEKVVCKMESSIFGGDGTPYSKAFRLEIEPAFSGLLDQCSTTEL